MAPQPPRRIIPPAIVLGALLLVAPLAPACGSGDGGGGATSAPATAAPGTGTGATATGTVAPEPAGPAPDYADAGNWLARPGEPAHAVDVFYLYPTVWSRPGGSGPMTAAIDDQSMRKGAEGALRSQASAFEPVANIFAPYYRQASGEVLEMSLDERDAIVGGIPTTDAVAAFDHYLTQLNEGRPYILAGHSQGSNLLVNLLAGHLRDHPDRYDRMIAAYVIGYSVTADYLATNPHLRFAERADDLGVIVSYNTEAPDVTGPNPILLPGALAINPISWTLTPDTAPASRNLGSLFVNADGTTTFVDGLADAQVDLAKGVVVCSTCDVATYSNPNPAVPRGVFHTNDYAFYYFDIRMNAAARAAAWTARHG